MLIKIVGLAIGLLLAVAGIVSLVKEKDDSESRKVYVITIIIGIILTVICAVLLFK